MVCSTLPTIAAVSQDALDEAVVVALGANLPGPWGSPAETLSQALARMEAAGLRILARSSWWRSAAWPDPAQPPYLNAVALVETSLDAAAVLAALQAVEQACGRVRSAPNAPRVLDLDLIAHGRTLMRTPALTLPHPRAAQRRFVMGPLAEIAPSWRLPPAGPPARELAQAASVGVDAAPLARSGAGG